jgi:hypothetical protein
LFKAVQAPGHPAAIRDGKTQRLASCVGTFSLSILECKFCAQGSDPMKPKFRIPPKQRPIMFLMFGLALVFTWFFAGLANLHADTRYRSTSNGSRFRSNTVFHGVAFVGGLNDVQDTAGKRPKW